MKGLGWVTYDYMLMLLGKPGIKSDTWVGRFVDEALGRSVDRREARDLLVRVSRNLDVNASQLDRAIWRHMRARP